MRIILTAIGALVAVALGFFLTLVYGMRTGNRTVLDAVRNLNRAFTNPRQLATAGQPGAMTSVIRHIGRKSGREYSTPVGVRETDEGFVISLPYGPETDWVRNTIAAGSAVIVHEGREYPVDRPEVVPVETTRVIQDEPAVVKLFGVRSALLLRHRQPEGA